MQFCSLQFFNQTGKDDVEIEPAAVGFDLEIISKEVKYVTLQ